MSPRDVMLVGVDPDIESLASRQLGLVTTAQLLDLGLSNASIKHRVRRGVLRPVRTSVYRLPGAPQTWEQSVAAALLSAGHGAVASHWTAGHLWALAGLDRPNVIDVTAGRWLRLAGVRSHVSRCLGGDDVTYTNSVAVTTPERTLCDVSGALSSLLLARMTDAAIRRGLFRLTDLERCLDRLPGNRPAYRMRPLMRVIDERKVGPALGDSELEGRAFRALRRAGLPDPVAQYQVRVAGGAYVLDMAYPEARVGIELDGWAFHGCRSAFDADRTRGNAIRNADWHLLQFTSRTSDSEIVATVSAALALRQSVGDERPGRPFSLPLSSTAGEGERRRRVG